MIRSILLLILLTISLEASQDFKVAKVGKEEITFAQIEKAYNKNLKPDALRINELSKDSLMSFVNLYIDYRLKVLDAIDKGYLQDSSVMSEFESNRKVLAESFYFDYKLIKPAVDKIMERRQFDLKFAYIIIAKQDMDTSSQETPEERAKMAMKELKDGKEFAEVAKKYSSDPQAKRNGGVVNTYITGGKIQRPLEDALYTLEAGEFYPNILETRYGYFLLKLIDKQARDLVYASHILLGSAMGYSDSDSLNFINKADSLIALLKDGADFGQLAKENTMDEATAIMGGSFGEYYSRSTGLQTKGTPLLETFENALFDLEDGEISGKVWTQFGLHIIKRDSSVKITDTDERLTVKKLYKRANMEGDKEEHLNQKAKQFGLVVFDNILREFVSYLDTNQTTLATKWYGKVPKETLEKRLFQFNKKFYTVKEYIDLAETKRKLRPIALKAENIKDKMRLAIDDELMEILTKDLENEVQELSDLLNEFKDGIILFKAEDEEVWQKREFDTTMAREYWEENKEKFYTNHKVDFSEIFMLVNTDIFKVQEELEAGAPFDSLAGAKTQRSGYREQKGRFGLVDAKRNRIAKLIPIEEAEVGKVMGPIESERGFSLFLIHQVVKPRMKTFEEAFSEISPVIQERVQARLRREWLDGVKERHPVKIYESSIKMILDK